MLIRCKRCVATNSRPEQVIDKNGICNACLSFEKKKKLIGTKEKNYLRQKLLKQKNYLLKIIGIVLSHLVEAKIVLHKHLLLKNLD